MTHATFGDVFDALLRLPLWKLALLSAANSAFVLLLTGFSSGFMQGLMK
jgi:hypothetical protein